MNDDTPIQVLTQAEYEKLLASFRGEEGASPKPDAQISAGVPGNPELPHSQAGMELGLEIWQLRKAGYNRLQILEQLQIPLKVIDDCLRKFEAQVSMEAAQMMEHYRVLDNERIEELLKCWLPIATGGPIRIEKIRGGEVFSDADFDRPLKASYFVLQAIERRLKIMEASRPEAGKDGNTNVMVWLQSVLPSLEKIVQQVDGGAAASRQEQLGCGKPSGKVRLG